MPNRLCRRLVGSLLVWDIVLTLLTLYASTRLRVWFNYGYAIDMQAASLPWPIYLGVAGIWAVTFLLLAPQRALFTSTLIVATGRLMGAFFWLR